MQTPAQKFTSECGKASMYVENDMPIGILHDFLMFLKGLMVDKMVAAHQEQTSVAEAQKQIAQDAADAESNSADAIITE